MWSKDLTETEELHTVGKFKLPFWWESDTKGHKLHRKFRKGVEALCRRWRKHLEESVLLKKRSSWECGHSGHHKKRTYQHRVATRIKSISLILIHHTISHLPRICCWLMICLRHGRICQCQVRNLKSQEASLLMGTVICCTVQLQFRQSSSWIHPDGGTYWVK